MHTVAVKGSHSIRTVPLREASIRGVRITVGATSIEDAHSKPDAVAVGIPVAIAEGILGGDAGVVLRGVGHAWRAVPLA